MLVNQDTKKNNVFIYIATKNFSLASTLKIFERYIFIMIILKIKRNRVGVRCSSLIFIKNKKGF